MAIDKHAALVEAIEAQLDNGSRYLEMMYSAYLRETQIPAHKVALVVLEGEGITTYQFVTIKKADELMNQAKHYYNKD